MMKDISVGRLLGGLELSKKDESNRRIILSSHASYMRRLSSAPHVPNLATGFCTSKFRDLSSTLSDVLTNL